MPTPFDNLVGIDQRLFADPAPSPDETQFQTDNTSAQYFNSPYYRLHKTQLQPVPAPKVSPPILDLSSVVPADLLDAVVAAKRVSFHAVGDTGAAKVNSQQTASHAIANEASVADAMTADVAPGGAG